MKKIILFSFLLAGFAISSFGQATATATATATIVTPISISKTVDMNFGNVAVNATGGTVVLTPAGTRTATGVTLPNVSGTVTAASFSVLGAAGYSYAITLPSSDHTITRQSGTETMVVNAFTSNPSSTGTLGATSGAQTLNVGATLNVSASQAAGVYTNATGFDVTVNYN